MSSSFCVGRTVVLADRESLSRHGTQLLLEQAGLQVVAQTASGPDAVAQTHQRQPDLLILDLELELLPGIEVIRQVRRGSPSTRIMVLTAIEACASVVGAIRAGASGYVLRGSSLDELHRALDSLCHGDLYIAPRVARYLVSCRNPAPEGPGHACIQCLTGRELQIAKLVAEGHSSPQIGTMLTLSSATVDRHRANLMSKLSLHSVPGLVLFAVRAGLVDPRRASA